MLSSEKMKQSIPLFVAVLAAVLFWVATRDLDDYTNPYKFVHERDGIAYYSYCTETNCTLVPESEVPEKYRD